MDLEFNTCGCPGCGGPEAAQEAREARRLLRWRGFVEAVEPGAARREAGPEAGWRLADVWVASVVSGVPCTAPEAEAFAGRIMRQTCPDEHPLDPPLRLSARGPFSAWPDDDLSSHDYRTSDPGY